MSEPAPMPSYWALADEVTHLHGRLDTLEVEIGDLKEENAELLETLNDTENRLVDEWNRACNAERENGQLRELVRDMWRCLASLAEDSIYHIEGAVCGCGVSCVVNGDYCSAYKLRDRARELGVEV